MFRLMEKARKNNKGFSLVELIVVVLIIAIIAVALAPQVMKYVGQARTGTDANNAATLKSAVQVAVADYQNDGGDLTAIATTYKLQATGTKIALATGTATTAQSTFIDCMKETTGEDIPKIIDKTKTYWEVVVSDAGVVTVKAHA